MIRISICDDENYICNELENVLKEILDEKGIRYETDVFYSGESLCSELGKGRYNLIFLDIELPEVSGIGVGKYIREVCGDETVQIAYISAKEQYAMELFEYRPINFLVKPLDKNKVLKVIDKYLLITEQDNHVFRYKKSVEYYTIPMADIIYFENDKRKVKVFYKDGADEFYESMENVYRQVKNHKFLFIHKSIIVNYRFVKKMSYDEVTLLDGIILPISQSRRKAIKSMYMDIRKEEM